MLPAVGQGALSVEMRRDDPRVELVAAIDDAPAHAAVDAERALLAGLRAGCAAPVGAVATASAGTMELRAAVLSPDGSQMYECTTSGPVTQARDLGADAAKTLIGQGAGRLLGDEE